MSEEGLKRLEALKITPGPWSAISGPMGHLGKTKVADKLGLVADCEIRISEGKCVPHGEANAQLIAAAPALLSSLRAAHDEIERLKRVADQAAKYKYGFRLPTPIIQGSHDFFNGDCETDDEFAERVERHLPYGEATVYANDIYECWRPVSAPDLARFLREQQGEGEE
ncbi:MAG: hypothetical protein IT205_08635 [Fimbriimonadaceae bacterium]|nr:hypothetical protein [Fimbriimonadaceae bacterium]